MSRSGRRRRRERERRRQPRAGCPAAHAAARTGEARATEHAASSARRWAGHVVTRQRSVSRPGVVSKKYLLQLRSTSKIKPTCRLGSNILSSGSLSGARVQHPRTANKLPTGLTEARLRPSRRHMDAPTRWQRVDCSALGSEGASAQSGGGRERAAGDRSEAGSTLSPAAVQPRRSSARRVACMTSAKSAGGAGVNSLAGVL
jgi:hypothetical protein